MANQTRRRWWITSDTHLGHNSLIKMEIRPWDFSYWIVKHWCNKVEKDDWVIHLGDLAWPDYYEKLNNLPGHKILVRGNHDQKSYTWYQNHGFDLVCEEFTMKYNGLNLLFSHEPRIYHNKDLNIHGHLHSKEHRIYEDYMIDGNNNISPCYCVTLEEMGYDVFSLDHILKLAFEELKKK